MAIYLIMLKDYKNIQQLLVSPINESVLLGLELFQNLLGLIEDVQNYDYSYEGYEELYNDLVEDEMNEGLYEKKLSPEEYEPQKDILNYDYYTSYGTHSEISKEEFLEIRDYDQEQVADLFRNELIFIRYFADIYYKSGEISKEIRNRIDRLFDELIGEYYYGDYYSISELNSMYYTYGSQSSFINEQYYDFLVDVMRQLKVKDHLALAKLLQQYGQDDYDGGKALGLTYQLNHASPQEVIKLSNSPIKTLKINHDYLVKLPKEWKRLEPILHLDLSNMTFPKIPDNFDLFPNIETLNLSGFGIGDQYEHEYVMYREDAFVTMDVLPKSIQNLSQLRELNLMRTNLGNMEEPSQLPNWLGKLEKLETLHLPFCYLRGYPISLTKLKSLKTLYLPKVLWSEDDSLDPELEYIGVIHYDNDDNATILDETYFQDLLPNVEIHVVDQVVYRQDFAEYEE
ncbi:MAG: hypothetical protein MK212_17510 [Saprospiraceae bacterium]|nr:hypothetical protein [Saprospiraceae bacterium]